jgi:uncharacterized protein involved in exopolysaccharide biosynthesis
MSPGEDRLESNELWEHRVDGDEESFQIPAFLRDPVGILRRRWPWMLVTLILGLTSTAITVRLWEPLYVARATILITSQQIPEDFIRSTVREDSIANIDAMVGRVLSRENLAKILDRQELYAATRDEATRLELIGRIRGRIEIGPTSRRGRRDASLVYELSFADEEPVRAAEVVNALAALFIESSIARRSEQAQRTTEFLKQELERNDRELREQSRTLSEFRRAHRGELPTELDANLRKLDALSKQRDSLNTRIAEKENRIASIASAPGELLATENEVLLDELRRQLARELPAHTEEHPNIIALRRRIEWQEKVIAEEAIAKSGPTSEVSRFVADERRQLEVLKSQLGAVTSAIADLNRRVDRTPIIGEEFAALEQKEQVLREDYLQTLRKVQDARLAESLESAQQGAQVSILDRARPPGSPTLPGWQLLAGGLGASLALTLGIAVLLELIDPVVLDAAQLEALAGQPVLGSLPRIA